MFNRLVRDNPELRLHGDVVKQALSQIDLNHVIVEYTKHIDKDELFASNIQQSIAFLNRLASEGWTSIEERWYGYEDNYIVACKKALETEDDYLSRIYKKVETKIEEHEAKQKEKAETILKINKLKDEIKRLEKTM